VLLSNNIKNPSAKSGNHLLQQYAGMLGLHSRRKMLENATFKSYAVAYFQSLKS